jgi:ABC-type nitrate/sulfonate/bicarbonate transport system permease component
MRGADPGPSPLLRALIALALGLVAGAAIGLVVPRRPTVQGSDDPHQAP